MIMDENLIQGNCTLHGWNLSHMKINCMDEIDKMGGMNDTDETW